MLNSAIKFTPGDTAWHEDFGDVTIERVSGPFGDTWVQYQREGDQQRSLVRPSTLRPANDNISDEDAINPASWRGKPVPEREWYVEGLIPSRTVTILTGDGGVGKSLLALQIAAAGAMGVQTCGLTPAAGRTLYLGAEDDADEFHRRLVDVTAAHGRDLSHLGKMRVKSLADADALLCVPDSKGNLKSTPLLEWLAVFASKWQPKLIVLDTAADLFGGDEIKRAQVRQFIAMLRHLALQCDCAVLLLAHPSVKGIDSGSGNSGSTAWNNSVRSRLYMTRPADDDDGRILKTMKSNYGKASDEFKLRWRAGAFVVDDGKPTATSMLLAAHHERVFMDVLEKLLSQGQRLSPSPSATYAPKLIAMHPDAKGIGKREFADAMQRLLDSGRIAIAESGPASRRYRHIEIVPG